MRRLLTILAMITLLTSCNIFDYKEKKAIEICQKAKVQIQTDNAFANLFINAGGLGANATWLDFANMIAKQEPNKKYEWHAEETDDSKFYIVEFTDSVGWGQRWEVDTEQRIVKSINQNDYLTRKYGFSRFCGNDEFAVTEIEKSGLEWNRQNSYGGSSSSEISYVIKASVLNKTSKIITSATIGGKLQLIFKDKTIAGVSNYESGFISRVSENCPWEPNTTREFYIKTIGLERIYLSYIPEYVIFDISLKAEDPIGYSFDKDIADMDLKKSWKSFKNNLSNSPSDNTNNSSRMEQAHKESAQMLDQKNRLQEQRQQDLLQQQEENRLREQERARQTELQRQQAVKQQKINEINKKMSGAFGSGGNAGSSGTAASGKGFMGSPTGNSTKGTVSGVGENGSSVSYSLSGRSVSEILSRPSYSERVEGKIEVEVVITPDGKVISADIDIAHSSIASSSMRQAARRAALQTRFNNIDSNENQMGTITYVYRLTR